MRRHQYAPLSGDEVLPKRIGAALAQRLLGISRTTLHELAQSGRLPGRLIDRRGPAHWEFKLSDVLRLKEAGTATKHKQRSRRQIELWERYYGPVPQGFAPAFRDGDRSNASPNNLCLVPLRSYWRLSTIKSAKQERRAAIKWTAEMKATLRARYAVSVNSDLANELGVSVASLRRCARKLRLRKDRAFIRQLASAANCLPVGTERLHDSTGSIWVKVAQHGDRHCERWRPKQHLVWEEATGQPVPIGYCVIFKDGNKENFDPGNLELISKREMSARGFARYLSYPNSLQKAIKLTKKLDRALQKRQRGESQDSNPVRSQTSSRRGHPRIRIWTPRMDVVLRRKYPTMDLHELSALLGVTHSSLRNRARRLRLRRLPETIIAEARRAAEKQCTHTDLARE